MEGVVFCLTLLLHRGGVTWAKTRTYEEMDETLTKISLLKLLGKSGGFKYTPGLDGIGWYGLES